MALLSVIIPAAGSGKRMNTDIPKPFLKVAGKSILEHTIARFSTYPQLIQVIVASQKSFMPEIEQIKDKYAPEVRINIVEGAGDRQGSVYNALQRVDEKADLVAVHDAVRPFINHNQIRTCCEAAEEFGGAVVGIPAKDTIKRVDAQQMVTETPERASIWQAQTPQIFQKKLFIKAHETALKNSFKGTDDASLIENMGGSVKMVMGKEENFKITFPVDLKLAELLLEETE